MTRGVVRGVLALSLVLLPAAAAVAGWPYLTEEAANLTEGRYSLSLGVGRTDRQREERSDEGKLRTLPAGMYWVLPAVQGTLGVGSRAEVSFDYEYLGLDPDDGGHDEWESGDLRLWTKLVLLRAARQALSLRFGVKLPNATHLGTNETDFLASALYDLTLEGWVATANLGIAVIGDPTRSRSQDDLLTWGLSLGWKGDGDGLRGGVETAGENGPMGFDRRRDSRLYAGVLGWQWGHWRLDGTVRYGVHGWDGWGWLAGVTYDR